MTHVTGSLQAYLDGELSAPRRREVEAHLADCTDCRRELAAARELWQLIDGAAPRPASESIWPELAARLERRRHRAVWTWPQRGLAAAALAAGVVLGVVIGGLPASTTDVVASESVDYLQDGLPSLDELWFQPGTSDEDTES